MKQFLTAIAANLLTIAICVVGGLLLIVGIAASAGSNEPVKVAEGSVLVIDLEHAFSDRPAETPQGSFLDDALSGGRGDALPLRAATIGAPRCHACVGLVNSWPPPSSAHPRSANSSPLVSAYSGE